MMMVPVMAVVMGGNGECGTCERNQQERNGCELFHALNVARFCHFRQSRNVLRIQLRNRRAHIPQVHRGVN